MNQLERNLAAFTTFGYITRSGQRRIKITSYGLAALAEIDFALRSHYIKYRKADTGTKPTNFKPRKPQPKRASYKR